MENAYKRSKRRKAGRSQKNETILSFERYLKHLVNLGTAAYLQIAKWAIVFCLVFERSLVVALRIFWIIAHPPNGLKGNFMSCH